ncbi:RNA recognition motif domain-containing protein [Psychromonas sp. KJ10-2]|uniref:RNA recognition motif domain-containing protein n=1 Tax=Psychromonas sp. KJ10-2 TaxID=3391822 RepID=UPI0039B402CE
MKLLVRNLAKATTEDKLLSLFKEYGNVQSCNLVLDKETGASKGFAFIEMPKVGEAKAAIKQLNSYKLAGNLIRVKKADTKKEAAPETRVATAKPAKEAVQTDSTETAEMVDPATVWGEVKDEIKE